MRPSGSYGEVRAALIAQLEREPMTVRAAAEHSQVGLTAARWAIARAVRSGTVRECGRSKAARGTAWEVIYELTPPPEPQDDDENRAGHGWVDLGRVVGGWAR
jgi:hypothetical protein